MYKKSKTLCALFISFIATINTSSALAASGEMGTGTPQFGIYSGAIYGGYIIVWSLGNATIGFPAGCSYLYLTSGTLGADTYKAAIATLTTARVTDMRVRFYAHADRDGGCGVDYFELRE